MSTNIFRLSLGCLFRQELLLILTLFLLHISWNLLVFGKCSSISFGKAFPMFVSTFTLYGGTNHVMLLLIYLFFLIFISFLKQRFTIFTKTQLYKTIATTTISSLLELFLKVGAPQRYTK